MSDNFFSKLSTLVQAHINNIVDPIDEKTSKSRKRALSRMDIRGGLQKDVKVLRQRIDDALQYETELQNKADQLYAEIAEWDQKADGAVSTGKEEDARFALGRMQQAQRELEMTEADLQEHRTITQELISQVNMLDSTIQAAQDGQLSEAPQASTDDLGAQIVKQLDNTRENLSNLISDYTARITGQEQTEETASSDNNDEVSIPVNTSPTPRTRRSRPIQHPVNNAQVDDDYAARLSRLSKPDDTP